MRPIVYLSCLLTVVLIRPVRADDDPKPDVLKTAVELGPLGEYFKVVTVEHDFDPMRGGTVRMKLEVVKPVDTSRLKYKIGFYDKDNRLHLASEVRFDAAFPLEKGESIQLKCWDGREPQEWKRIVFRKDESDAPKK
jgi:hypothetical protein